MVTKEELAREETRANAILKENVMIPNTPIVDFLQEAGDLIPVVERDKNALKEVNMDINIAKRLEPALEVLRDKQTAWMEEQKDAEDARKEWGVEYPKAQALRRDLMQTARFVYEDNEVELQRLSEIAEGDSYRDTIQDLHDLAFKGKEDKETFTAINYDMSNFDKAEAYSNSLMLVLARMNGDKYADNESKLMRDKAYTNLRSVVDYVRKYGKYVFRNDPDRAEAYQHRY